VIVGSAAPAVPAGRVSGDAPATVVVKAPMDVTVTVNGQALTRRAAEEEMPSPSLRAGQDYAYTFEARATRDGRPTTLTRRVIVRAGQRSTVDFSSMTAAPAAAASEVGRVALVGPRNARVTVDGVVMGTVGSRPTFETPKLEAGRKYVYTIKADLPGADAPREVSKRVTVEAGKTTTVDFSELVADLRAARR
jgi:uncharacterized protein (TIGR03000 family)